MIVACQVMDPGLIPGERMFLLFFLFLLVQKQNKKNLFETSPQLPDPHCATKAFRGIRHQSVIYSHRFFECLPWRMLQFLSPAIT